LDFRKFAEGIFDRESKVIYVGVVDSKYTVIASEIRKGVRTINTPEYIRNFVQITPVIIVDALEKLQLALGRISSVVIRYEKRVLLFSRYEDMIVVLGFEVNVPTRFAHSMAKLIADVAKQSD
jgi:hypothetical protein